MKAVLASRSTEEVTPISKTTGSTVTHRMSPGAKVLNSSRNSLTALVVVTSLTVAVTSLTVVVTSALNTYAGSKMESLEVKS